jgi:hypothetical protein
VFGFLRVVNGSRSAIRDGLEAWTEGQLVKTGRGMEFFAQTLRITHILALGFDSWSIGLKVRFLPRHRHRQQAHEQ